MPHIIYVTLRDEDKILAYDVNEGSGEISLRRTIIADGGPGPLAVDPKRRFLHVGLRGLNRVATYAIDRSSGDLRSVGVTQLRSDPCYLSVDKTGRWLLSAYYGAGMCSVHGIGDDGVVWEGGAQHIETHHGAHCIHTDASNRFAFLPHVMPFNRILQFRFDAGVGRLRPNAEAAVRGGAGQGPRHYVFHASLDMVYTSDEQGSSATAYGFDPGGGTLAPLQTVSTLPSDWEGKNTTAQIHIHPTGRYLYVANRGHDSIAVFRVGDDGLLTALGQQATEPTPRVFCVDPTGQFLYVAGQGSGRLASYRIDVETGTLSRMSTYGLGLLPMWVLPLAL